MATLERPITQVRIQQHKADPGGWTSWLTTVDHKKIGIMYLISAFFFFLLGGIE